MGLADVVKGVIPGVQKLLGGPGGLLVTAQVFYNGTRTYNAATGQYTPAGGQTITTQALRYSEDYMQTSGIRVNHHPTDGIVAPTEKILFFTNDFPAATLLKKQDVIQILGVDGTVEETWQITDIKTEPTRSIVICSIERS